MDQRMIRSAFKDELNRKSVLSYLAPIVKQQGEPYGLIEMTQVQVSDSSVVTTFIWPDCETAMAAWDEYGGKVTKRPAILSPSLTCSKASWNAPGSIKPLTWRC